MTHGSDSDYEAYRSRRIESGLDYQDFVVDCCWNLLGLAVVQYAGKKYQLNVGESKTGVEIKNDMKFRDTGNLWIEAGEKARPRPGAYANSGIFRDDNTWLYVIGDYDTIFIFAKNLLRGLFHSGRYKVIENNTKTSRGFLLPHGDAVKYAAQVLYPNAADKIGKDLSDLLADGDSLHAALCRAPSNQLDLFSRLRD